MPLRVAHCHRQVSGDGVIHGRRAGSCGAGTPWNVSAGSCRVQQERGPSERLGVSGAVVGYMVSECRHGAGSVFAECTASTTSASDGGHARRWAEGAKHDSEIRVVCGPAPTGVPAARPRHPRNFGGSGVARRHAPATLTAPHSAAPELSAVTTDAYARPSASLRCTSTAS